MMEGVDPVKALLQYSQLNLKVPLNNLSTLIKGHLAEGFTLDAAKQYCNYISTLNELICHYRQQTDIASLYPDIVDLLENVCLPLLHHICPTVNSRKEVLQLLGCVGRLISSCTVIDKTLLRLVFENLDRNLAVFIKDKPTTVLDFQQNDHVCYDVQTMLEVLRQVLIQFAKNESYDLDDTLREDLTSLFDKLVLVLADVTLDVVGSLCIPVLLKMLQIYPDHLDVNLKQIWDFIVSLWKSNEEKQYMLLCGFANHLFPISGAPCGMDLRGNDHLWQVVQAGLASKESINRKRSLYILKRVVDICETSSVDVNTNKQQKYSMFWWDQGRCQQLSRVWEDFMLLAEVFEDKQVHVIKPILPRMKTLLKASQVSNPHERPLLHTSWLTVLFYRCSFHESLRIVRWASDLVLSLDLEKCPLFEQGQDKYLTGPLLDTLKETKLYVREQDVPVGSMPQIADKLVQFYTKCWQILPQDKRGAFFCQTVEHLSETTWSFLPLLFITRGLSQVPASPCLDQSTITSIRKLLVSSLSTAESYLRGTIQCFLLQMLINLTDKGKVQLEDIVQIISGLYREESLQRGTTLWEQTCSWLLKDDESCLPCWSADNIKDHLEKEVVKFLETSADSELSNADFASAAAVARILLLVMDGSQSVEEKGTSVLVKVLQMLVSVINSINTHAYMPQLKADKALILLNLIVMEMNPGKCSPEDPIAVTIRTSIGEVQSELLLYITRQMSQGYQTFTDFRMLDVYIESLTNILVVMETVNIEKFGQVISVCCRILQTDCPEETSLSSKLNKVAALRMLGKLADFLSHDQTDRKYVRLLEKYEEFFKTWKVVTQFPKPRMETGVSQKEWGKVTSMFLQGQWQVVKVVLQNFPTSATEVINLIDVATETLTVGLEETVFPVIQSLQMLVRKFLSDDSAAESYIVSVIDACWVAVVETRRPNVFLNILEAFGQTAFQRCLICRDEGSQIVECLRKYSDKIVSIGLGRGGVANVLVSQLWSVLQQPGMVDHLHKYIDLLLNLCMFGDLPKRTDRQLFDVCAAISSLGSTCSVNDLKQSLCNEDLSVRATAINIMCLLDPVVEGHRDLAAQVIKVCVERYTDILKTYPYVTCSNSLYHRHRNRLIQVILLLEPVVTEKYLDELWTFLWESLEQEGQPSVRHMLEWIAIATISKHDSLVQDFWKLFTKFQETKNIVLLSLLSIVVHVGPHLDKSQQADYFSHAIPAILPWCMAHHFNTRIFAQAALSKLWEQCHALGLSNICDKHAVLQTIVDFNEGNRNSTKNVTKLLDSFFFKYLDIKKDYSIETVCYTLPKMTGMSEDEWLKPELFLRSRPAWESQPSTSYLPLYNPHKYTCAADIWRYRGGLKAPDEDETEDGASEGDVQKKIMPWRQMMIDEEAIDEIDFGIKQSAGEGLIVVTSLIDKIPNLGGLCRTSEIFGVSEYVLGRLQYVEEKVFQSLSVTAHKWLPMTEVFETKLPEYLQQKRLNGYTLVGVEQTANSVCLTDFTFPEKTLLLLGNEKEGIPVDLIGLLDVCVEIPQQGVVRSLNVHVSGALLIWEYRRQQLVKNKS